ncbi:hypothetical protein [Streptomyces sp. NRRL S-146]|uniref:hypothetical protein n=1 Tax=Streptomyces sp. NRRL S-146 TaxID=1463884 RepID=UPI00069086B7|nr:hypothetical protein [Streptomyces sp. NRRL S-146]
MNFKPELERRCERCGTAFPSNWIGRPELYCSRKCAWGDPEKVDQVLRVIDTRFDGKQAAAWSRKRNCRVLNAAMKYAVRRRLLRTDPLPKGKESTAAVKTTNAVDKRSLLNPEQAAAILDWIRCRPCGGERLHAFFATLYYCGPRPEEAVAMRVEDVSLPDPDADDRWCELLIHTALRVTHRTARPRQPEHATDEVAE